MKRTLIVISILVCSFGGKAMADYDQLKEELDACFRLDGSTVPMGRGGTLRGLWVENVFFVFHFRSYRGGGC